MSGKRRPKLYPISEPLGTGSKMNEIWISSVLMAMSLLGHTPHPGKGHDENILCPQTAAVFFRLSPPAGTMEQGAKRPHQQDPGSRSRLPRSLPPQPGSAPGLGLLWHSSVRCVSWKEGGADSPFQPPSDSQDKRG